MLFGGITLGAFSPNWSDVDLIVWVNPGEVTPHLRERALYLWNHLAERPLGTLLYLYVAPMTVLGGPMNVAGGGVPGQPSSLRVYRHKARWMEGYPLSLPDTVSLRRYGAVLAGRDVRSDLPEVPDDWPVVYLRERLEQLIRAVSAQVGPYGPDVAKAAREWGAEGIMTEPLWCARHLYSVMAGDMLSKEDAAAWYIERFGGGPLAEALTLILGWRELGSAPDAEVVRVAGLVQRGAHQFLGRVAEQLGMPVAEMPPELAPALAWVHMKLTSSHSG